MRAAKRRGLSGNNPSQGYLIMLGLNLKRKPSEPLSVLCLGAHPDDIEIGCGGTVLSLVEQYPRSDFLWIVFSGSSVRAREAEVCANAFLNGAEKKEVVVQGFRDGFFPYQGAEIKEYFEGLKRAFQPDIVLTHYRDDRHQDHRFLNELTWNTFRNHVIIEYEIPKYDGDFGSPNFFVPLSESILAKKISLLQKHFVSQAQKHWFSEETFRAVPRMRGMECASTYAEAFYCRKTVLASAK